MSSSSSQLGTTATAYYHIISKKDRNLITFSVADKSIKIMKRDSEHEEEYKQTFGLSPVPAFGKNRYRFFVMELDSNGEVTSGSHFLDFNPHAENAPLISSEPTTGRSQVWFRKCHEKEKNVWYIQASNEKYLKNNGPGVPISVSSLRPQDRKSKKFQWLFIRAS